MKTLRISQKLSISYLLIGLLTVITISFIFYRAFEKALKERTLAQLSSINVLKKARIEDHFQTRKKTFEIFISNPSIENGVELLQNINSPKENPYIRQIEELQHDFGYKKLLLFNKDLKILYPFSTDSSVIIQQLQGLPAFKDFLNAGLAGYTIKEFSKEIGGSEIVLLVASPLLNKRREIIGTIVVQKNFKEIEDMLHERTGMGNTGESYLVGSDYVMRSASRFFPNLSPLKIEVKTLATKRVFQNEPGEDIIKDYRDEEVLSAYRRLEIQGLNWAIISEIDIKEALRPIYEVRNYILISAILISLLIIIITFYLARKISSPILKLKKVILELSKGILPTQKLIAESGDEIGQMAQATDELIAGLKRTSNFAFEIGNGNFSASYEPLSAHDVLGTSLLQMRNQLKILQEQQINIVRERSSALLEGQEEERKRIARELHDGIGQMLTATKQRVGMMEGEMELQKEIKDILDQTINEVRRISFNLMPSVLIDFGLEAALKMLCSNTEKYFDALIQFEFNNKGNISNLKFEASISIYRIVQEAFHNIIKYAEATKIELKLDVFPNRIVMQIADNGVGFNVKEYQDNKVRQMNGIKNMKERAELLNGKFEIKSKADQGTTLTLSVPL